MRVLFIVSMCAINVHCAIRLSENCRNFSIEMYYFTALKDEERGIFMSPFGIWSFMFNVMLGVSGTSAIEVRRAAILLNSNEESLFKGYRDFRNHVLKTDLTDITLTAKNYIFLDEDFVLNPEYYRKITYDVENLSKLLNLKFVGKAKNTINNYLSQSIASSLTEGDLQNSRMIMSTSISFKGQWELPFNKSETVTESFYDENGNITGEVVMMHQRNQFSVANVKEMGAYVLELAFGSRGKHCLLIMLPSPGKTVTEVYKSLVHFPAKDIFYKLYNDTQIYGHHNIDIKIPRFRVYNNIALKEPLNDMGVYGIFDQDHAEFTRVSSEKLFVSTIKHDAFIEVTESGAVSSSLTSAVFADDTKPILISSSGATSDLAKPFPVYRINPPGYIVNKPFLYFVIEKSSLTVLFGGVYLKPSDY